MLIHNSRLPIEVGMCLVRRQAVSTCEPDGKMMETCLVIGNGDPSEKDELITYVNKLTWLLHFTCLWFSPKMSRWRLVLNLLVCAVSIGLSVYLLFLEFHMIYENGIAADLTTSATLCSIFWAVQAIISVIFMIHWQLTRQFFKYLNEIVVKQKGEFILRGRSLLRGAIIRFHYINVFMVTLILLHFFAKSLLNVKSRLVYVHAPIWIRPLHSISAMHLFIGWNFVIFVFNMFVNGTYLELRHCNRIISKIDGTEDESAKENLLSVIALHSRIIRSIRGLDRMFQVYAFTMISTMIPFILMTVIMVANRLKATDDLVVTGIPALLVIVYGFLGLTISPARLYDEAMKSKSYLSQNLSLWLPYRPEIYQIAHVLSDQLQQPNMGVTIWGFALLTKPLILATFSVMAMLLSLIIDLVPSRSSHDFSSTSTTTMLSVLDRVQ